MLKYFKLINLKKKYKNINISIVIPTLNRSIIVEKLSKLYNHAFCYLLVNGSDFEYKIFLPSNVRQLHLPGYSIKNRLKVGINEAIFDHIIQMSDDDLLLKIDDVFSDSKIIYIPSVFMLESNKWVKSKDQFFYELSCVFINPFRSSVSANLVAWSALYPKKVLNDIHNVFPDSFWRSSFIFEKMLLVYLFTRGYKFKINKSLVLLRDKTIISEDLRDNFFVEDFNFEFLEDIKKFYKDSLPFMTNKSACEIQSFNCYMEKIIECFNTSRPSNKKEIDKIFNDTRFHSRVFIAIYKIFRSKYKYPIFRIQS
jgi:hypothetical protein